MVKRKSKKGPSDSTEYEYLLKDLLKAKESKNFKEVANVYNQLGHLERRRGNFAEAIEHHKNEKETTKKYNPDDRIGLGVAYRNIGEVYMDMNNEDRAVGYFDKYLRIAVREKDLVEQQRAHITIGRLAFSMADKYAENDENDPDAGSKREIELSKAEKEFKLALDIVQADVLKQQVKEKELAEMKCGTFHNLGLVYESKDDLTEAKSWFQRAINVAKIHGFSERLLHSLTSMFNIHVKEGEFQAAHSTTKEMVKISKQVDKTSEMIAKLTEAKALFYLGDVDNGLAMLKRIRIQVKEGGESMDFPLEELEIATKAAVRIIRAEDERLQCSKSEHNRLKSIHERIGDNLVTLGNLREAVNHYKLSLTNAMEANYQGKSLAVLYYSVAQTYRDMGMYAKALEYHYKELDAYAGSEKDEFRTQVNIAECLEKMGAAPTAVAEAYKKALLFTAATSKSAKLVLMSLSTFYKKKGKRDISEEYLQQASLIPDKETEPEEDSQDLLSDGGESVDLDSLSLPPSESEEEELDADKSTSGSSRRTKFRRNEKGETPLHVAAQKGDVKAVRRLIAQGHEVNPRDYCGWIPLHEACNFGHYEVVVELLKNRAQVNDTGGSECRGITPLHDAASNGHFTVIDALIEYGAKTVLKDKEGSYPLDALIGWYIRANETGSLSSEQKEEFRKMKEKLMSLMSKAGHTYTKKDEQHARKSANIRAPSPEFSLMRTAGDDPVPVTIKVVDPDDNEGKAGVREYDEAMQTLRRKSKNTIDGESRRYSRAERKDALLAQSQVIAGDWLVPDENLITENSKTKRKRDPFEDLKIMERKARRINGSGRNALAGIDLVRDRSPESLSPLNCVEFDYSEEDKNYSEQRSSRNSLINEFDHRETDRMSDASDPCVIINSDSSSEPEASPPRFSDMPKSGNQKQSSRGALSRKRQAKLPFKRISSSKDIRSEECKERSNPNIQLEPTADTPVPKQMSVSKPLRLKVEILGKRLLVPVTAVDKTVNWLCKEVAARYQREHASGGMQLKISLQTKDGAMLSENDTIEFAISETDTELVAIIQETTLIDLNKRFMDECERSKICPDSATRMAIASCETSEALILNDVPLRGSVCTVLASCLKHAIYLRVINLSGCSLRDDGIAKFCNVISTTPKLEKLDLSCNGITSEGLSKLTEIFLNSTLRIADPTFRPPMHLKQLILSHNPFGNALVESLLQLIPCLRQLRELHLVDCNLTASLFSKNRRNFVATINDSNIKELDFSYNHFGKGGLMTLKTEIDTSRRNVQTICCD